MKIETITKAQKELLAEGTAVYKNGDICSIVMDNGRIVKNPLPGSLIDALVVQAARRLCFSQEQISYITDRKEVDSEKYYQVFGPSIAGLFAENVIDFNCDTHMDPVHIFVQSTDHAVIIPISAKKAMENTVKKLFTDEQKPFSDYVFYKKFSQPLRMVPLRELYNKYAKEDTTEKYQKPNPFAPEEKVKDFKKTIPEDKELAAYRATGLSPEDIEAMKTKLSAIERLVYQNDLGNEDKEEQEQER